MKFMITEKIKMGLVPRKVFFTKGVGVHEDAFLSFELALKDAGIKDFNLVRVSSIIPPNCKVIEKEKGLSELRQGQIVYCVMAKMTSNSAGKTVYASIGAAIPDNTKLNGYLVEDHGCCESDSMDTGKHAKDSAVYLLETSYDVMAAVKTNVAVKADVEEGKYTTVVAAAIFVM